MPHTYTVAHYVADLRAIRSTGSATAETSFYPPFDKLLNAVGTEPDTRGPLFNAAPEPGCRDARWRPLPATETLSPQRRASTTP